MSNMKDYMMWLDDKGIAEWDNHELLVECSWTPEEQWLNPDGGMTADALTYLHELDSKGELI